MRASLDAFVDGLLRPTGASLAAALAVAVVTITALCLAPLEPLLASGEMVVSHDDEYAWITAQVLQVEQAPPSGRAVWVLASSATREALASTEALREGLAQRGAADSVTVLAAGGLGPHEALALLDHLPVSAGDAVVMEASPRNFAWSPARLQAHLDRPRLPLRSPTLDAGARAAGLAPPRRPASLLLAYPDFWSARLGGLLHLVTEAPMVDFHLADQLAPPQPAQWAALELRLVGWGRDCMAHFEQNAALYRMMTDHVAGLGARLFWVQAPRNPAIVQRLASAGAAPERPACQARIQALADELGATLLDPARGVQMPGAAFIDHAHIIDPAVRSAFTDELAAQLSAAP